MTLSHSRKHQPLSIISSSTRLNSSTHSHKQPKQNFMTWMRGQMRLNRSFLSTKPNWNQFLMNTLKTCQLYQWQKPRTMWLQELRILCRLNNRRELLMQPQLLEERPKLEPKPKVEVKEQLHKLLKVVRQPKEEKKRKQATYHLLLKKE